MSPDTSNITCKFDTRSHEQLKVEWSNVGYYRSTPSPIADPYLQVKNFVWGAPSESKQNLPQNDPLGSGLRLA
jgi:hypothetical protein